MNWYFSKALTAMGLLAGLMQVAVVVILEDTGANLQSAVGVAIALLVGGMLIGAAVDVFVEIRKRARRQSSERTGLPRKR
ncbi:MAG TPA: hypothetical protein VD978_09040 [Azospirillum sp.]|nr:hypothetical protein [Azospirillum sp.]